jgi:NADPH-dependent 7-cyano-7-deazaguanine reductase QueF
MTAFAEALAVEIANEVKVTLKPKGVRVQLTLRMQGGIEVRSVAESNN